MMDRRKQPRWALHVPIKVRFLSGATPRATMIDLSTEGCRLQVAGAHPGDHVILRIAGFAPLSGNVVWAEDEFAGLKFDAPLHEAILDHLLANERAYERDDIEELKLIAGRCAYLVRGRHGRANTVELDSLGKDCSVQAAIATLNRDLT
jgi:hypothetical protein